MSKHILIATKGPMQANGLFDIYLDAFAMQKQTHYLGRIIVNSGAPGCQTFRTLPNERKGQLEPCPEGVFNLGPLVWKGKPGNYKDRFASVDSPIWVEIDPRRAIGFHLDGNRRTAPGSAGCLVFKTEDDMKQFVNWWNGYGGFGKLYCDWGLGYMPAPKLERKLKNND